MEDKLTNLIIAIIFVIVIILAGVYAYKLFGSKNQVSTESNLQFEDYVVNSNTDNTNFQKNNNSNTSQEQTPSISIVIPTLETNTNINISANTNTQTVTTTIDTYEYNNRYYYNQLDNYAKEIYDAIVNNMDKLKTGNSRINIDYDFSKLMNDQTEKNKLEIYYSDAVNAINLDIPNLFYIDLSKLSLNIESTTSIFGTRYNLYIDSGKNQNFFYNGFNTTLQVEESIYSIEAIKEHVTKNINGEDYTKTRFIHDWIVDYLSYSSSSVNKGTVYGALKEKEAVCEGYARACKYLLDSLGIENILITGTATNSSGNTEEHMWNYVKIDDNWYALDCTWDDPIVQGGGSIGEDIKHRYFLIGSSTLSKTHTAKNIISPNGQKFNLPTLSQNKY